MADIKRQRQEIFYDLMLIANDDNASMAKLRGLIATAFEDMTDQDLPENGWMVDEMVAGTGLTESDMNYLQTVIKAYWLARG